MKFIITSCVFPPEPIVSAKTSYSIATGLVNRNHHVKVISNFPIRPEKKLYKKYKRVLYFREHDISGFTLLRCFSFGTTSSSLIRRLAENISFGITSSLAILFSKKPDALYSNTWPIFATGLVCVICKIRKIPMVLSIQDLYPESLTVQNRFNEENIIYKILLFIDKWIVSQAAEIIVISERIRNSLIQTRGITPSKVNIIPNWVDKESIFYVDKTNFRDEIKVSEDTFVIMYGGNIGKAAGVESLIEAVGSIQNNYDIVLVIAGSGSSLSSCKKIASQQKNVRIIFYSNWKSEDTSRVLSAADILILTTQGNQSLVSVPSKLISYMLSERPIIASVLADSETADVINKSGCGWVIPPDSTKEISSKIIELSILPKESLEAKGKSGREYALANFTSDVSLPKIICTLESSGEKCTRRKLNAR